MAVTTSLQSKYLTLFIDVKNIAEIYLSQVTVLLPSKDKQMLLAVFSDLEVLQVVSTHHNTESHFEAAEDSWGKFSEKYCQHAMLPFST